ncbi:uncharacterized protein QC763_200145 [Podospora pseudopauciseta]|uniref:Uncharacterized protein n=1 Tax=Podospora pseudopauciseta TaxID=2093780 RepID=A0ABR0HM08_9PEZI|nr:hypothetical protein QC763_200145 [Podospora pseudopauciseta]
MAGTRYQAHSRNKLAGWQEKSVCKRRASSENCGGTNNLEVSSGSEMAFKFCNPQPHTTARANRDRPGWTDGLSKKMAGLRRAEDFWWKIWKAAEPVREPGNLCDPVFRCCTVRLSKSRSHLAGNHRDVSNCLDVHAWPAENVLHVCDSSHNDNDDGGTL